MKHPYRNLIQKLEKLSIPSTDKDHHYIAECIHHCLMQSISWQRLLLQEDLGDDWLNLCDNIWTKYLEASAGELYLAVNPSDPLFYKFGKAINATSRHRSLNNASVLNELIIVEKWAVPNRHKFETLIRAELGKEFLLRKEFVKASYNELHPRITALIEHYSALYTQATCPLS